MKRLLAVLTALAMLAAGGATPSGTAEAAEAAEASCCWLYCEAVRDSCWIMFRDDREMCDAYYQGCIDGCQYPGGPTSGGGGAF